MMWSWIFLSSCIAVLGQVTAQTDGYCLASDYDPYLRFSSKTAYEFVKGKDNNQHYVTNCVPIYFWSMNRHGTRLPGLNEMDELPKLSNTRDDILTNYDVRRTAPDHGRLCNQDLENLKLWFWNRNFTKKFADDLTYQGYDDIRFLAKRWQSKYPTLLPSDYSPQRYEFRYTEKRRTKDSYRAFVDGLFGRDKSTLIPNPPITPKDKVLETYKFCDAWQNNIENNPAILDQVNLFKKKEEYQNMIMNVSNHLGFKYPLDEKIIDNIYDMCRYDKSWEINKNSPWCAAFNKEQLQLIEYAEDLKYFYKSGYGSSINKDIGCMAVADFMGKFKKRIENPDPNQPLATVYFTHSVSIQTLLTAMDVAKDSVPLTSDNYHTPNIQRRNWRTSLIDPFASNLATILYKCDRENDYKVMFYLNEKPVEFEDCRVGLCTWETVKKKFERVADECNLDFCFQNSVGSISPSIILQVVVISIASLFTMNKM